jgi:hypothetical protein
MCVTFFIVWIPILLNSEIRAVKKIEAFVFMLCGGGLYLYFVFFARKGVDKICGPKNKSDKNKPN